VTLDEIGAGWRDGRAHLSLRVLRNGQWAGQLETGAEMHFSFFQLVEHIAKTRAFTAGTLLGSGTVSSADASRGVGCLAEKRAREKVEAGEAETAFLSPGETVEMELFDSAGQSICGSIRQEVVAT
jgi:fumarylacetoacetate (FAA) hydrolase